MSCYPNREFLYIYKLFFKKSRPRFIMLFIATAARSREEIRFCTRLERVSAVIFRHFFPKQLSYLFGYSRINFLPQELSKASLYPSLFLQFSLHRRICRRSYSRAYLSFAYCRMKISIMMGSRCSMVDFSNSISYKSFSMVFSLLNSGSMIAF